MTLAVGKDNECIYIYKHIYIKAYIYMEDNFELLMSLRYLGKWMVLNKGKGKTFMER